MFDKVTRNKLRFSSTKGMLTVEDLWDLSLTTLNDMAKVLNKKLKTDQESDFLDETPKENSDDRLRFDTVLHILEVKKQEKKDREVQLEKKTKKEKLLNLLAEKQDAEFRELSVDQIKEELSKL